MNDHPIDAVREARQKISEQFDHDPRKLVEHCRKIQEQYKDRVISPGSELVEREESVESAEKNQQFP